MGLFDDSIPVDFTPEQDTVEETAEQENVEQEHYEEQDQADEVTEETETDPDKGHSEELIFGKYKTLDEAAKAFKNLERQFHESRQPKPAQQQQPPQQQQSFYDEDPNAAILEAINRDPIGTINYFVQQGINQALAPLQEERSTERLASTIENVGKEYRQIYADGGMETLFEKVNELAQELGNPQLAQNPTQRVLRMAAEEIWGKQTTAQVYRQAVQAGRQQAEAARQAKVGLNAPSNTKPKPAPKTDAQTIAEGILAASRGGRGLFG